MADDRPLLWTVRPHPRTGDQWTAAPQLDSGYLVGSNQGWRTRRPHISAGCARCGLCFLYCPDGAVAREVDGMPRIASDWCKGCGICAVECPKGAIEMVEER